MHSGESVVGPAEAWHESCLPLGGEGCPEVAEFAVVEFAAALGRSTESGRRYLSHAVEGFYRLRRCWARLEAGELPAWRLGFIAERTVCLSPAAAGFVDQHVAPVAHRIGPAQLDRLIDEAKARFDPEPDRGRPARGGPGRALRHPDRRRRGRGPSPGRRRHRSGRCAGPGGRGRRGRPPPAAPGFHRVPRRPPRPRCRATSPAPNRASSSQEGQPERRTPRQPRRVVLHVHLSTPPILVPAGSPGSRSPRPDHRRPGPRVVRPTPARRSPSSRSSIWPSTCTSARTRPAPGSSSRPSSATGICAFPFCFRPAERATANIESPTRR